MPNGALVQLAATGAQDSNFISEDPADSIFKESTSKACNFVKSTESMRCSGNPSWGNTINFKINKEGDLLNTIYFVVKLPKISKDYLSDSTNSKVKWGDYIGNLLIENIKLKIGGQIIDEQSGDFIQLYTDMYDDDGNKLNLIGMDNYMNVPQDEIESTFVYVPLKFWFCESLSKSLPLIALQYHDVEVEIKLRKWNECVQVLKYVDDTDLKPGPGFYFDTENNPLAELPIEEVRLDCNFIYLSARERKEMAQKEHKILITQTQRIRQNLSQGKSVELSSFNHPVKEMYFYITDSFRTKNTPDIMNFSNKSKYPTKDNYDHFIVENNKTFSDYNYLSKDHYLESAQIKINGHNRTEVRDYKYYYFLQNYEYFRTGLEHYVYLYSFSGNPRASTPLGTLNFSRVSNAQLRFNINKKAISNAQNRVDSSKRSEIKESNLDIVVFVVNYNYLVIKGGMGGLMYSN